LIYTFLRTYKSILFYIRIKSNRQVFNFNYLTLLQRTYLDNFFAHLLCQFLHHSNAHFETGLQMSDKNLVISNIESEKF